MADKAARARSPFAPSAFPSLPRIEGVEVWSGASGLRAAESPESPPREDLMVMRFAERSVCAGLFTRSSAAAAPVVWSRDRLREGSGLGIRAVLVNAGQANAMTGERGVEEMGIACEALARHFSIEARQVLVASTGVIGQMPNGRRIAESLPRILSHESPSDWQAAAGAITTTDSFAKGGYERAVIDGVPVNLVGIAKGAGMIAPDMATMLAFIVTDAVVEGEVLRAVLRESCDTSFHAISVDGDMSTNDTVLAIASGAAGNLSIRTRDDRGVGDFRDALSRLMGSLARQIVADGEGIGKFLTVRVSGASSCEQARVLGLSVVSSALVKTAIAGGDANWGRVAMALGKTRIALDLRKLSIAFDEIVLYEGAPRVLDGVVRSELLTKMGGARIGIRVDLGEGEGVCETWGCDLTREYLRINSEEVS